MIDKESSCTGFLRDYKYLIISILIGVVKIKHVILLTRSGVITI